ncbi:MAG: SURF1 family protein [Kordiimonadaceae bacterium]|nr:SURF1 family protein [Kordiimonadaceae bacterium]
MRSTFKPGLPLSISTGLALLILVFLGTWQGFKIAPKAELLRLIENGLTAEPVLLPLDIDDTSVADYRRVQFAGTRMAEPIRVFGMNRAGAPGYFLYAPVKRANSLVVIVNFGWVPLEQQANAAIAKGKVAFRGIKLPSAKPGTMSLANDPTKGTWYLADVPEMAAHFGLKAGQYYDFRVFADHTAAVGGLPLGGQVLVRIPNNHFEYMLTWYGLAAALIAIFLAFGYSRGRKAP